MNEKHQSSQFETHLTTIKSEVLAMGNLVVLQVQMAMRALNELNPALVETVIQQEERVDEWEIEIDAHCSDIIARRQPTAKDLRLLMAISKTITNLERAGDEAKKIAKRTRRLVQEPYARSLNYSEIKIAGALASSLMQRALDAFMNLDLVGAAEIVKEDQALDNEFKAFVRKAASYMAEDPGAISASMDLIFVAKALERVGDHAKNVAEFIFYIVKGTDVRHSSTDKIDREASEP